ncbi:MAG TPA: hypothetical protein VLA82_01740, partial [Actinomycetota bacterium]|nr:hypothetical protein [Actinomycetota bacterium]
MAEVPSEIHRLVDARAAARAAKDFARADEIRDELAAAGWRIVDGSDGRSTVEPVAPVDASAARAAASGDALDRTSGYAASLHWVCEGWPDAIDRAIAS